MIMKEMHLEEAVDSIIQYKPASGWSLLTFVITSPLWLSDQSNWGYKENRGFYGPSKWKEIPGSSCGGIRQSPIDIKSRNVEYWPVLRPIVVVGKQMPVNKVLLKNDTMSLKLFFTDRWQMSFGNQGCLRPVSIHWHWGSFDNKGSEHYKNGQTFPMEGHLVSYNCKLYNSIEAAIGAPKGLYVIGFFYQIGQDNTVLNDVLSQIPKIKSSDATLIDEISPMKFLPLNLARYYRYEGSLTTPPCTENVIWTVMDEVLSISSEQLKVFRSLQFGLPEYGPMVDNFRPVISDDRQSDYVKRTVYASFNKSYRFIVSFIFVQFMLAFWFLWSYNLN